MGRSQRRCCITNERHTFCDDPNISSTWGLQSRRFWIMYILHWQRICALSVHFSSGIRGRSEVGIIWYKI
jgi:hypothetical protein